MVNLKRISQSLTLCCLVSALAKAEPLTVMKATATTKAKIHVQFEARLEPSGDRTQVRRLGAGGVIVSDHVIHRYMQDRSHKTYFSYDIAVEPLEDGSTLRGVPSMIDSLEVQVLYPARWRRRISEAQGRRREAGSEGSVEQSRDPMDKNRIRGLPGRTSEPLIAKSIAIKGRGGKSGGCAVKAVGLTSGGLRRVRKSRTERDRKARDRGAEVSRGHSSRFADEGPNDGQG